jgi:hypothetical protein
MRDVCPAAKATSWSNIDDSRNLAPYQGSDWASIDHMLDIANLQPGFRLLDLGAGDGRILIRAVQRGSSYAEGWELNKEVFEVAQRHIEVSFSQSSSQELSSTCNVVYGDVIDSKPTQFDIVTMFLLPGGLKNIQNWLDNEVKINHYENVASDNVSNYLPSDNKINNEYRYLKFVTQGWMMPGWLDASRFISPTGGTQIYLYLFRQKITS